ncbi:pyridoxamine 5'-phosphate oxidase family protein [Nocardioides sp. LHD-245]|uniref:pyridoxamine 5'-phosphate oxidase family protein n=1 Tax=Nocardioides sp. LHD-245 TaxID=3051387 RepID=UPI0027DF47E9|nr:pyridoxamine 5'-phosphate oxidase family protein [Nocardioides sp. LHD-245]
MSIPVDPADLRQALADFDSGYLLTTSSPQVKVVTVDPVAGDDGTLRIAGPGRGTLRNLAENPAVTVVFPPRERHGYTLLVDGTATTDGEDGGDVVVTATTGVLHRPAAHADGPLPPDGCGHDCAPVG